MSHLPEAKAVAVKMGAPPPVKTCRVRIEVHDTLSHTDPSCCCTTFFSFFFKQIFTLKINTVTYFEEINVIKSSLTETALHDVER